MGAVAVRALIGLLIAACAAGCDRSAALPEIEPMSGGDPRQGKALISAFGCGACHTIPGVERANGLVGPPLTGLRNRMYIAGVAPNTPDNLIAWIRDPRSLSPRTVMPAVGVDDAQARDIAAFLYHGR